MARLPFIVLSIWHELEHHPRIDWGKQFSIGCCRFVAGGKNRWLCRDLADEVALTLRSQMFRW